jgi:hypothetical protein
MYETVEDPEKLAATLTLSSSGPKVMRPRMILFFCSVDMVVVVGQARVATEKMR